MTETQGWIAIGLLVAIFAQLVQVAVEINGLRRNVTSGIDTIYQRMFGID